MGDHASSTGQRMITISIDQAAVTEALQRIVRRTQNIRPALSEIGATIVNNSKLRFRSATGPDGQPWPELSETTLIQRAKRRTRGSIRTKKGNTKVGAIRIMLSAKPLLDTGVLRNSIHAKVENDRVLIGSGEIYAATMQFGATKGQFKASPPIPWGTVPPRPYLGVSDSDGAEILSILADHLSR